MGLEDDIRASLASAADAARMAADRSRAGLTPGSSADANIEAIGHILAAQTEAIFRLAREVEALGASGGGGHDEG